MVYPGSLLNHETYVCFKRHGSFIFVKFRGFIMYILWGFLLGLALAMDAFSVSITNRISEPNMKKLKINLIALTYAIFQGAMPLLGYLFSTIFF